VTRHEAAPACAGRAALPPGAAARRQTSISVSDTDAMRSRPPTTAG
jgi:hypothetical protein